MIEQVVLAHGIKGRSDLPVPIWLAAYGGGLVLLITFIAMGVLWRQPRFDKDHGGVALPGALTTIVDSRWTRRLLRAVGVLAFAATAVTAAFGGPDSANNPAPIWMYVWLWVGLIPASLLLGPIWRLVNPLRAVTDLFWRLTGSRVPHHRTLPRWARYWPAAFGLLVFTWLELVYDQSDTSTTVLLFLFGYSAVQVTAALRYGPSWYQYGDSFEVYSNFIGHLSPLGRDRTGRIVLRNPMRGLAKIEAESGTIAVVCVMLGSTAFDGLTRTDWWSSLSENTTGFAYILLGTVGLLGTILLVFFLFTVSVQAGGFLAAHTDRRRLTATPLEWSFAHSLIPISIGYSVAHYFSFFMYQGQAGIILASDPFARGWNLLGSTGRAIDYSVVSPATIAIVQVGAIIIGHVLGVFAAHDRALNVFAVNDRNRAQVPLLIIMVLLTLTGITLVARG